MLDTCDECRFTYELGESGQAATAITTLIADYRTLLDGAEPADLRHRPRPDVWAPLEYACHVRDLLLVQRERVLQARRVELPSPAEMGRDERVEHDGYSDQAPADVARQLSDAALLFGNVLDRLSPADWERKLVYNYPERQERSLRWLAVHTLHEVRHHLLDIRRQLHNVAG